jgi:hypothetical protein
MELEFGDLYFILAKLVLRIWAFMMVSRGTICLQAKHFGVWWGGYQICTGFILRLYF